MKILYILPVAAVSFMLLCCKGGDIREDKYPDGSVRLSTPYVQGKREGVEKEFYESGKLKATRHYKAGVITDTVTEFFESGKTESVTPYKDGAVEGFVVRYYDNGNVASKTLYAKGLIAAFPEEYDSLGNPAAKGTYEDQRDHKKYDWVRIGGKVWTAQNIDFGWLDREQIDVQPWILIHDVRLLKVREHADLHPIGDHRNPHGRRRIEITTNLAAMIFESCTDGFALDENRRRPIDANGIIDFLELTCFLYGKISNILRSHLTRVKDVITEHL